MNTRTKLLTAGIATLALTGGVGATLASADTPSPVPSSSPSTSAAPSPDQKSDQKADKKAGKNADKKHRSLQARALHGEATVGGAKKQLVVDFQRGTVTKVSSSSITVRSADGFTATYAVGSKTKVRVDKEQGKISEVKAADRVRIVATKDGSAATARSIGDRGAKR